MQAKKENEYGHPHLHRDRARPMHICSGTGLTPYYHICSRTGRAGHVRTGTADPATYTCFGFTPGLHRRQCRAGAVSGRCHSGPVPFRASAGSRWPRRVRSDAGLVWCALRRTVVRLLGRYVMKSVMRLTNTLQVPTRIGPPALSRLWRMLNRSAAQGM